MKSAAETVQYGGRVYLLPTIRVVAVALSVIAALIIGGIAGFWYARVRTKPVAQLSPRAGETPPDRAMPPSVLRHISEGMDLAVVVLDVSSDVAFANAAVRRMGVVRGGHLIVEELHRLARDARESGAAQRVHVDLPDSRLGREPLAVSAHVVPLDDGGYVALFLQDVTESQRLAAVRRDFVANVSHELKTPVGAMTLLAEAIQDASDDPEAVRRFAARMQSEGGRLGRLVQELIELSRLQGADPLPSSTTCVPVDKLVSEAVEATRLPAESDQITVVTGGEAGLTVRGDLPQLVMALVNLVGNAIAYSPPGTKIAVGTQLRSSEEGDYVEIAVADQGIGIAEGDRERIFERFYRADPARSRATGGTGLGLAIVKHIATNHGGSVRVWSVEGSGSTFTLRLPAADVPASLPTPDRDLPVPALTTAAGNRKAAADLRGTA
jgi:two-component system sensor histidine kinase SenX3